MSSNVDPEDISEVLELGLLIMAPRDDQPRATLDDVQTFMVHVVRLRLLGHLREDTAMRLCERCVMEITRRKLETDTHQDHKLRPRPTAKDTPHEAPGQ